MNFDHHIPGARHDETGLTWHAVYCTRKYLPETITGDSDAVVTIVEQAAKRAGTTLECDEMTDQIDVRQNGRKIAVYMIGA